MRFIDSNVLVAAFYANPYTERCQQAIREGGATNTLCLIEAFHAVERITGSREKAAQAVRMLMRTSIIVAAVDTNTIFAGLRESARTKLAFPDLIHYTTALQQNCTAILSYDRDFDRLALRREEP